MPAASRAVISWCRWIQVTVNITRDQREHAAGAIEERDRAIGVIDGHDAEQVAVLVGVIDEVVEVAEGIDHDVQPDQAEQADHQHLHELAQHVAVDDRGHGAGGCGMQGAEDAGSRDWRSVVMAVECGSIRKGRCDIIGGC